MIEYMEVTCSIIGTMDSGYGTHYYGGCRTPVLRDAVSSGFQSAGETDDFLVAIVEGDVMTDLRDPYGQPLEGWDNESYLYVAEELGLTWKAIDA